MEEKTAIVALVHGTTYQMLDAAEAIGRQGESAVLALERSGPPSAEALILAAGDCDWRVRISAIWALEHVGNERSIPSLIQNLHGANECCRWMAAAALNRIGDDAIRQTVEKVFVADPFGPGVIEELIEGS